MEKIILASSSPRRKDILNTVGAKFQIVSSDIEEKMQADESPRAVVAALAFEKGIDVASRVEEGAIVIASDTVVYKDMILGKPKDEEDAFKTLQHLRNGVHSVFTGICIIKAGTNEKYVEVIETKVYTKDYSDEKINNYIKTGEVWGKAGSYAIQGYGSLLVERIEGDYLNIVGLPIARLESMLEKHFKISFL
jgi:septum formation protein